MRRLRRVPCLLIAGLFAVQGGCNDEDELAFSDLTLRGQVRDDFSDRPLRRARVTFTSDTLDTTSVKTNDDGDFKMEVDVPVEVQFGRVMAEKEGYEPSAAVTVFFDGTARWVELRLRPR